MYILGIGGSNHDFSTCLIKDDKVLCMIEDERITRKKHSIGLGVEISQGFSRKYCLGEEGIELSDVDLIVSNDIINPGILYRLDNVKMINHHLAHAASTFYCSPFKESAILIIDSVGSKEKIGDEMYYDTITYAYGCDNHIDIIQKNTGTNIIGTDYVENSIGIFYSIITEVIGFYELQEGKTMGLAPYGTDRFYNDLQNIIVYNGDGKVKMSKENIEKLLSYKDMINAIADDEERFSAAKDFAWAAQKILEDILLNVCEYLYSKTKCRNLCIAGGVALNSVANYKIYKKKIFNNVFIQPAAGDNGTSIGAALYGYYEIMNKPRNI